MHTLILPAVLFFCIIQLTNSQPTFKITLIDGTAKVQRSQKKSWENIALGDEIDDNDIIETFFQTKTVLQFGAENVLILGSNTRALCNVKEVQQDKYKVLDVNITLFSGGALVKIISDSRASIYTANAVAQIDSGTISTVVEAKTGHTGFQVLGGKAQVRNVAQQQAKNLSSGLTTIVLPGKEPTAPLYITYRHVAVLKHFFGDDYIQRQIDEAGIEPTEEQAATNRLSLSENLGLSEEEQKSGIQKRLFTQNMIWGVILDDRVKKLKIYSPIEKPPRVHSNKGEVAFNSTIGIAGGSAYPMFLILPAFYYPRFSFGIKLPLAKYGDGSMKMNFTSAAGVFDKIHHLTFGNVEKKRYLKLGPIEHYTVAEGLLVNNFNNKNVYTATQPLGITTKLANDIIDFDLFIADITNWYVGGLHFGIFPGNAWLGLGYYYDANQFKSTVSSKNSRFLPYKIIDNIDNIEPSVKGYKSNTHVYEINTGFYHSFSSELYLKVLFQFARKFTRSYGKGYIIKGPEMSLEMSNFNFGISYIQENGPLLLGHFSSMYMSNRTRIRKISSSLDTLYFNTQNMLFDERESYGFTGFFNMTPRKGMDIRFHMRQDFLTKSDNININYFTGDSITDTTGKETNSFDFGLSFSINEKLLKPFRYAAIYANQVHGAYYPQNGTYFTSWGFNAGFDLLTAPLFFNIALDAGLIFTYLDLYDENGNFGFPNDNIDSGDYLFQFYLGLKWGFL